ncbi:MAG: tetratricopeptide repeat protein, partial [Bartonella sp.]|nr:tetratricopeptide repeat protein [Bartonella sp.]
MTHDNFIYEVNEELRQEKFYNFWKRYGFLVIGAVIIFVLTIIVYQIYQQQQINKANNVGDIFIKSLDLADANRFDEAIKKLESVKKSDFGGYPFRASLREASLWTERGDTAKSVKMFDMIAADEKAPQILREVAKIRAAYILVDTGTFDDVMQRVKEMANDIDPMRMSAREALGLAAYKANKMEKAVYYFKKIVEE